MPFSLQEMLGYVPLVDKIKSVESGIPNLLPPEFFSVKQEVLGDRARNVIYKGTRKAARVQPYGAPARQVPHLPRSLQDFRMLATAQGITFRQEFLRLLQQWEAYEAQDAARQEIEEQTEEFKTQNETLRVASVMSLLANGKMWFDAEGNLLTNSSGADQVIDFGFPASSYNQLNPGGGALINASWSNTATDIATQVLNIVKYARQTTGYPLKYAFYGVNIPSYIFNNESVKWWLRMNEPIRNKYLSDAVLPDGLFGLTWVPMFNSFFEDKDGNINEFFGPDQITFTPEITKKTYTFYEGSYFVPKSLQPNRDIKASLNDLALVYGMWQYSQLEYVDGVPTAKLFAGDTFLPRPKAGTWLFADVTP